MCDISSIYKYYYCYYYFSRLFDYISTELFLFGLVTLTDKSVKSDNATSLQRVGFIYFLRYSYQRMS